jgi:hypothetical protein
MGLSFVCTVLQMILMYTKVLKPLWAELVYLKGKIIFVMCWVQTWRNTVWHQGLQLGNRWSQILLISKLHTLASHWHHGLRMIWQLQAKASDCRQHGNNNERVIWRAGPMIRIEFKSSGAGTGERASWYRQANLLTRIHVVATAVWGFSNV